MRRQANRAAALRALVTLAIRRTGPAWLLIPLLLAALALPTAAAAESSDPATAAEAMRSGLSQAQIEFSDNAAATKLVATARQTWTDYLATPIKQDAPAAAQRVEKGLNDATSALTNGDAAQFAAARATVWTALLDGGYGLVQHYLQANDGARARQWLPLREFRTVTRFARPNADATIAMTALVQGQATGEQTLVAIRADLLDTYQARLDEALQGLSAAVGNGFRSRAAEEAALASGYFAILSPAYSEQRGAPALTAAQAQFAQLNAAALSGGDIKAPLAAVQSTLSSFRAAPLTPADQLRRAGQLRRYLALVPVEYARGVSDGRVISDLEIQEATTFRDGAAAAFGDLRSLLEARDSASTAAIAQQFDALAQLLAGTASGSAVASADQIKAATSSLSKLLDGAMPAEWKANDAAGDFDVIASVLDRMEAAVAAGQYPEAESARLEAYAILETGPEAKLTAFAPQLVLPIEELFWYGQGEHKGLASLISDRAPLAAIRASRGALDAQLALAVQEISGNNAPEAVATNAGIIVFREGLETVLILASLMGSLKRGANRRFRKPLWWGAGVAMVVTVLTFLLARELLQSLAAYGEKLEAVVSLVAIGVLLLITNWFFHKVYWTGWIANFHQKKKRLIGGEAGQILGLVVLGFTSIYREGFETVLFLQALVLESGMGVVLAGVALGLAGTLLVGLLVFAMQAKLPYKKMLVVTGVMIGAVLLVMVGNTVHVLQLVGWLPIHAISGIELPFWANMWLGIYPTFEGVVLQFAAAGFVIGSYFLAERGHGREQEAEPAPTPQGQREAESDEKKLVKAV